MPDPNERDPPDEDAIDVDDEELEEVDAPELVVSHSMVPPGHPDYLLLTGQADPDVDSLVEDLFAKNTLPTDPAPADPEDERPTDPPPPPVEDPDDEEFRSFMQSTYGKLRPPKP
ncbi:hypothetical protein M0Q28_04430 [Patescibacteria group bacterium]|jgi:hypothetical protein|nr:hypothetical protein [Patescibacteria group bacterium]